MRSTWTRRARGCGSTTESDVIRFPDRAVRVTYVEPPPPPVPQGRGQKRKSDDDESDDEPPTKRAPPKQEARLLRLWRRARNPSAGARVPSPTTMRTSSCHRLTTTLGRDVTRWWMVAVLNPCVLTMIRQFIRPISPIQGMSTVGLGGNVGGGDRPHRLNGRGGVVVDA